MPATITTNKDDILEICSFCFGCGRIRHLEDGKWYTCAKCMGKGKLNWLDNITRPNEFVPF